MQIKYNTSPRHEKIRYIVIHDTGNTGKGADSMAHFNFFNGGDRQSSADFFVDDDQALQVNDYKAKYTWHCGDGRGRYGISNGNSVGVEMCINSDGNYDKAFSNTVALTKQLMAELGIEANHVVRHYDASRKNCPCSFSDHDWARWKEFKSRLSEEEIDMEKLAELEERLAKLENKMVYNYIDANMPDWAQPTIKKLVEKGYLKGGENGELGLTDDLLRVLSIIDRAGVFDR